METAEQNAIAKVTLDSAFAVHAALGPGLLESAYKSCLIHEMRTRRLMMESEVSCPPIYRDYKMDDCYRIEILLNGGLIVEMKAIEALAPIRRASCSHT